MIRCVRIWTGEDGNSVFEEGIIDLGHGERGDVLSDNATVTSISYRETEPGGTYAPHQAPIRQSSSRLQARWNSRPSRGRHS